MRHSMKFWAWCAISSTIFATAGFWWCTKISPTADAFTANPALVRNHVLLIQAGLILIPLTFLSLIVMFVSWPVWAALTLLWLVRRPRRAEVSAPEILGPGWYEFDRAARRYRRISN